MTAAIDWWYSFVYSLSCRGLLDKEIKESIPGIITCFLLLNKKCKLGV